MTQIDPRLLSALVGAIVVALGWWVSGRRQQRRDVRLRRERREDTQTALHAEIQHNVDILNNPEFNLDKVWAEIVVRMEDEENYIPVIPTEKNDTVFRALLGDIHVLPAVVIQPVVRYYSQVFAIDAMITDLRSDRFEKMDETQRIEMYTDYISLKKDALVLGQKASNALDQSLRNGHANRRGWFNTPGAARSDQK